MNKIFEKLLELIQNSTQWLLGLFILILFKKPIENFFLKISYWLRQGFNADIIVKILKPLTLKIEESEKKQFRLQKRMEKIELKFFLFEKKQNKIYKDVEHTKNNIKYVKNMLESIKKDEENLSDKIDLKSEEFNKLLNKTKSCSNYDNCKNYEEI